jgi:hypothetical protein
MYKVVHRFYDLQDNNYAYFVGDKFPHNGGVVDADRIAELAGGKNKMGVPLIEEIPEKPKKKAVKKVVETEE